MPVELTMRSVIIVGHDVNISIFKPPWLIKHNIFSEDELSAGDVVFSQSLVQVPAGSFDFLAIPDRIQMRLSPECTDVPSKLLCVLGGLVTTLPHTPLSAIGFNFEYVVLPKNDSEYLDWNCAEFQTSFARKICDSKTAVRFGSYCAFDALDMRIQVDIKPGRARTSGHDEPPNDSSRPEAMIGKINFHKDLEAPLRPNEVLESLGRWADAEDIAKELMSAASSMRS